MNVAVRVEAARGQACIVFRPTLQPAPMQQFHQRGVIAHVVVIRCELQRAAEIGECFVEPRKAVEQVAAIRIGEREAWIERYGGAEVP